MSAERGPGGREQAAVLALAARTRRAWHLLARALEEEGGALPLATGDRAGLEPPELVDALKPGRVPPEELDEAERMIAALAEKGVRLVTVLDRDYPTNLRLVYDRPPFLFIRGELRPEDEQAVAVVGTRTPSEDGLREAQLLARGLAERGVTVISGLALGIDGAAHQAALDAGGRTIAVIGNGIRARVYPPEHADLAERIVAAGGAVVSQFLPDAPPRRTSFPLRNRTMSGLALGTVVVEASGTSGAKMQARIALEHGRRVILLRSLVLREPWAQEYETHPGVTVVEGAEDVLDVLKTLSRLAGQLAPA